MGCCPSPMSQQIPIRGWVPGGFETRELGFEPRPNSCTAALGKLKQKQKQKKTTTPKLYKGVITLDEKTEVQRDEVTCQRL